jgi:hypothetical protein
VVRSQGETLDRQRRDWSRQSADAEAPFGSIAGVSGTLTILVSVIGSLVTGAAAAAIVTGVMQKKAELRTRRTDAALMFLEPEGRARTALLKLADLIDEWPGTRSAEQTARGRDLGHASDEALDEAQLQTTRMAILFNAKSGVEQAARDLLLAHHKWRERLLVELESGAADTAAPRLLRKAATAAETTFKQRASAAVQ